jgi:hypothetical protein
MSELLTNGNRTECRPLLEAAHINIYRQSPFRITGLPVDASTKAISKHADKLKMMEELGQGHGANPAAFALDPPPSVDQIRESIQRLKDPELRIIDEFFWFWPVRYGEGHEDPAVQAIMQGDSRRAYELWLEREDDPENGFIASHNIAVIFHLIALDWTLYHLAVDLDREHEEKIKDYWRECFGRWEKTATDDRVWELTKARIRSLDDPRLTTGLAQRMCRSLPLALDKINAEAALRYAEQNRFDWAEIHVNFMNETHPGLDDVEKTVELVLTPTRNRVIHYIDTAKKETQANAGSGHDAARKLIDQAGGIQELFGLFYKNGSHQKAELFDEVAQASLDCLVAYQRATNDNETFVSLLGQTLPFATSVALREKIQQNINFFKSYIRSKALEPLYAVLKTIQESTQKNREKLQRLSRDLLPELAKLVEQQGNDSQLVAEFSNALTIALKSISVDAHNSEEDFQTSLSAIELAFKIAKDPELRKQASEGLAVVRKSLSEAEKREVRMKIKNDEIEITRDAFRYNSTSIPTREVTGVHFGVLINYRNGIKSSVSYLVGIIGSGQLIRIECKRLFMSEEQAQQDYRTIIEGLYYQIIPGLVSRIANSITNGNAYQLGNVRLEQAGIQMTSGSLMWKKEHLVPWNEVRFQNHQGLLHISSSANSHIRASLSHREVWNAVIFEPIVNTLLGVKK